jgi:iron(III) transport system permease protein
LPEFNIYGFWGTWLSETLTVFPVAFLTLSAVLAAIDPNLEDASLSLGRSRLGTFASVTVPLTTPGLANAFLLLFASSLADFATPLVLAGHVSGSANSGLSADHRFARFARRRIALLHFAGSGADRIFPATLLDRGKELCDNQRQIRSAFRHPQSGPGFRKSFFLTVCCLVSAFILFLYAIIFLGSLVKVWGVDYSLTFEHYDYVFDRGMKAIKDTIIIACVVTPIGAVLGTALRLS